MPDLFQAIDDLDAEAKDLIAERLETRAENALFAQVRENYFARVGLPPGGRVHELGCGTGVVCRALARHLPDARISGSDLSGDLVQRAARIASAEGLGRIRFARADGQSTGGEAASYDVVLGHTVLSHVPDPAAFLAEALRLTRPGGRVVIHDGDYASFAFDSGSAELDRTMPEVYMSVVVANPYVMRALPRLVAQAGATLEDVFGEVIIQGAPDGYFMNFVENFAPMVRKGRPDRAADIDAWRESCSRAARESVFYGSCVFTTCVIGKPH